MRREFCNGRLACAVVWVSSICLLLSSSAATAGKFFKFFFLFSFRIVLSSHSLLYMILCPISCEGDIEQRNVKLTVTYQLCSFETKAWKQKSISKSNGSHWLKWKGMLFSSSSARHVQYRAISYLEKHSQHARWVCSSIYSKCGSRMSMNR